MKTKNGIIFFILLMSLVFVACKEDVKIEPKATLKLISINDTTGRTYTIKEVLSKDTTWMYPHIEADTARDAQGNFLRDEDNKLVIAYDTTYVAGPSSGKFIQLDTILLPDLEGTSLNELHIEVESNARWQSPLNNQGRDWLVPVLSTGGGDGKAVFKVFEATSRKRSTSSKKERQVVQQLIFTRDSSVMYQLPIDQMGYRK